jgi:hypothetical protein
LADVIQGNHQSFAESISFNSAGEEYPSRGVNILNIESYSRNLTVLNFGQYTFWGFVNWVFVSQYWLTLYDLGQTAPVAYSNDRVGGPFNFSKPATIHNSSQNIFVNATLFQKYSTFLRDVIIPNFGAGPDVGKNTTVEFLPLNETNRLQPSDTTLYRNYSCSERRIKKWFSLIISVFAANYALIGGAYTLSIFIAGRVLRQKDDRKCRFNLY